MRRRDASMLFAMFGYMAANFDDGKTYISEKTKGRELTIVMRSRCKNKGIPKGCARYWFEEDGTVHSKEPSIYTFTCIASNEKNAIRKFNKRK